MKKENELDKLKVEIGYKKTCGTCVECGKCDKILKMVLDEKKQAAGGNVKPCSDCKL